MYQYDAVDRTLVAERVAEYRDQTSRFLSGKLSEDEFDRCASQWPIRAAPCAHVAYRDSVRPAVGEADANAGRHRAPV